MFVTKYLVTLFSKDRNHEYARKNRIKYILLTTIISLYEITKINLMIIVIVSNNLHI